MFASEQAALAFMDVCRRELRRHRGVLLISDSEIYWDCMRGLEALRGHPGTSLESAAHLLVLCKSPRERRGGAFEVEADRTIKLDGREWLGAENWCRDNGWKVSELVRKLLWRFLEGEAEKKRKEERKLEKEFGWWDTSEPEPGSMEEVVPRGVLRKKRKELE
jgi:hypothetical protein